MNKRIVGSLFLLFVFATILLSTSPIRAQNEAKISSTNDNRTTEIRPDIGPLNPSAIVGEHGYKVFHPGAIKTASAVPVEANAGRRVVEAIRRGITDAWLNWVFSWDWQQWGWDHLGYHESESDLWESQNWADGRLKITTDSSWRDTCSTHTSGSLASCTTSFFQILPRTIVGETYHHFHTNGYNDENFWSSDSA